MNTGIDEGRKKLEIEIGAEEAEKLARGSHNLKARETKKKLFEKIHKEKINVVQREDHFKIYKEKDNFNICFSGSN